MCSECGPSNLVVLGLADSSKTAPRILIFSISMGADYSFELTNIEIWAPAFFKHNYSSVATMECETKCAAYNLQIMITLFQMSFSANISINLACLFRVASCLMIDSIEGLNFRLHIQLYVGASLTKSFLTQISK